MRELKLDMDALSPGLAGESMYDYLILIREWNAGAFSLESYGAAVVNRATGQGARVPDITVNVPRIGALMELLARNGVRPEHLRDVVDDWL